MKANLEKLKRVLEQAEVLYLSTSLNDVVSARPVSPLMLGARLFVRTSAASRKAKEMLANPHIAGCVGNFYFTGKAKALGSVSAAQNTAVKEAYQARYPGAFSEEDDFIQSDEMFFELLVENAAEWVYENGAPVALAEQALVSGGSLLT